MIEDEVGSTAGDVALSYWRLQMLLTDLLFQTMWSKRKRKARK